MGSEVEKNIGFGRSDLQTYTIPSGGVSTERVDLGRPYAFIIIMCEDASDIAATTLMALNVSPEEDIPLHNLYEQNAPQTIWSKGNLPTSNSFYFLVTDAFGARFIQPVFDTVTAGIVILKIVGYDPTVVNQPDR